MNQDKIGKFIAQRRKARGFLQKDIAERLGVSEKTISKWECGNGLPEVVFMEPLCAILKITVNELLAGESIPILELLNTIDVSRLELVRQLEFEQLKMRLYKLYEIEIESMEPTENGAGGLTYFVTVGNRKYVVKYPSDNEMNHPDVEIMVCDHLLSRGIPVCRFIKNKQGVVLSTDENGRRFTVQEYYEGVTYDYHEVPENLQEKSAVMLAKIHEGMKELVDIPVGIGAEFLKYRTLDEMEESYSRTLQRAEEAGDAIFAERIRSNRRIVQTMPRYSFDISRFSCGNTHGDYMISQLIWNKDEIAGVIDFTCACRHPYIWEIMRSYVFMAPEVRDGEINIDALLDYINAYLRYGALKPYDVENAGRFLFYFLAVCNFYEQYYASLSRNRTVYLEQANMAAGLLSWFEKHIEELDQRLGELARKIEYQHKLAVYYDEEGRLTQYPGKRPLRELALLKIADCFEPDRKYTEKEVNEIIRENISFSDVELIRREMFQSKLLGRLRDGSQYWREI